MDTARTKNKREMGAGDAEGGNSNNILNCAHTTTQGNAKGEED
jgi:hypothetical protein